MVRPRLGQLLEEAAFVRCTTLRRVFCGGEALPTQWARAVVESLPATVVNLYGPTEATIDATSWTWDAAVGSATAPIGRPLAHLRGYRLDTRLEPGAGGGRGGSGCSGRGIWCGGWGTGSWSFWGGWTSR